jgi:hypothetical protein
MIETERLNDSISHSYTHEELAAGTMAAGMTIFGVAVKMIPRDIIERSSSGAARTSLLGILIAAHVDATGDAAITNADFFRILTQVYRTDFRS